MEDWQEWQIRAEEIATGLKQEVSALEEDYFERAIDETFRGFWPRFRDLKERVRLAPAIRLEDKLELERRLRGLGSRAYKAQEGAYARSGERRDVIVQEIAAIRETAEGMSVPRELRDLRRDLDAVRERFDAGSPLVPADRQAVWQAWRDTNQAVWQRLTDLWNANETVLRDILAEGQVALDSGNPQGARGAVSRFFDALRRHEAKQAAVNEMKAQADALRRAADEQEETRRTQYRPQPSSTPPPPAPSFAPPVESWRAEVERNGEVIGRLTEEVEDLERRVQESDSILQQAMLRGTLVDKRRKLSDLERTNRGLEQRIEQVEEQPLIPGR